MRLLIHHHTVAYSDNAGIWVQSFIGTWVNELAKHVEAIGLLLHTSEKKMPHQDFKVEEKNVRLYSLGFSVQRNRLSRNQQIREICRQVSSQYEQLLIRGITPRQFLVYKSCSIPQKAFLLVGSITDSKPEFGISIKYLYPWFMYQFRLWELRQIAKDSLMLANSPNTVTELKAYLKIESHFAPTNTIRQDDFVPLQFRHFRSKPEILFCGRVVRDKGIEELIAAVGLLKNEGLECVLRVVGKADPAYQCQLQGIASTYSVRQQVYFEGFIPFGELLLQYYRNADLYVLPSWHEGFPHSIWEAAASCTPILATPVGGIPGNVSEDEIHFIQPKNPEEIAKKIKYLLESPEKAYNKIEAAYKRALNYTVEECSSQLFHILHHHAT